MSQSPAMRRLRALLDDDAVETISIIAPDQVLITYIAGREAGSGGNGQDGSNGFEDLGGGLR